MIAIATAGLTRRFGSHAAVTDLNLEVHAGEVYGFLGPNGAGKTTTIRMLLGLLPVTSGQARMLGADVRRLSPGDRTRIGVMEEGEHLYHEMRAREYLAFFADLYRVPQAKRRIDELGQLLDMGSYLDRRTGTLSRGMRQKLSLARAVLHEPDLLVLDEPGAGLDPAGIREVRGIIQAARARGAAVFFSSHILSEVERTADRVGIISQGHLLAQGSLAEVRSLAEREARLEIQVATGGAQLAESLRGLAGVRQVTPGPASGSAQTLTIYGTDGVGEALRLEVGRRLAAAGAVVLGMQCTEADLEDAFVTLTESNVGALAGELG